MAAATKRVEVKITYAHPDTQPPVYLAGAFSDPQWQPQEMQYTTDEHNQHQFYKEIEVDQGGYYEYKFRLGPGDWWVLDEEGDTVTDGAGNRNNVLRVPVKEETIEVAEDKKQESLKNTTFLSLTEKDVPVVETAELPMVEVPQTQELREHKLEHANSHATDQDSTFLKQIDGSAEKEPSEEPKIVIPKKEIETTDTKHNAAIEELRESPQSVIEKEGSNNTSDIVVKQLDGNISAVNTPLMTERASDQSAATSEVVVEPHDIAQKCPVASHDLEDDTYIKQYDGTSAVEEETIVAESQEKAQQQQPNTEHVQQTTANGQSDPVRIDQTEAISDTVAEKANKILGLAFPAQKSQKDSVLDIFSSTQKPASHMSSQDLEASKEIELLHNTLADTTVSEVEAAQPDRTIETHPQSQEKVSVEPVPVDTASKSLQSDEKVKPSVPRSNAPSIIDIPPRDGRIKSRSPSPGQLFSKAHLLRLQEKTKSPPIKEDDTAKDYLDESSSVPRPSSTRSSSGEKVAKSTSSPESPQTPPMSRRTSSKTKQSPRPAILSEAGGRSISDGVPTTKERVFPLVRQKSEGSSAPEVGEKISDAVITETNTFDGTSLPISVEQQDFHQNWSPLDWNPDAKAKYEEQQLRLEKIRRPLNHYYDAEKSAHRNLLNSKRGQTLHNLYNQRQAQSNIASQETKDMWKYIRHLREEKRYKTTRAPNNIPLTWVFHLDEPQHPRYTSEALDEHIHVIEDEIAFYTHREKVEAGTGGDRPNSWYSPASFDFVAEHRYLGSANGSSRRSKNGAERGRKSSSEYAATWKQKQAQIIAKRGDIFSKNENPQLDLLTRLDATGVETDDPTSDAPSSDWAHSLNQKLDNVIDSESDQDSSDHSRKQSSSSQGSGSSNAEPSNLTPLHVGTRQLGDEQRTLRAEGNGPQINLHPATPAPSSKDTEQDSKQLGHVNNDSKDKLKTSNTHKRNVSERSVTPSSLHTAGHDSKHSKNVFRTFLRFVFVEFWRGLFHKLSRFGKGPANVVIFLLVVAFALVWKRYF